MENLSVRQLLLYGGDVRLINAGERLAYTFGIGSEVYKTYPPLGLCIYCRRSAEEVRYDGEGKLEREHIIPFALYGSLLFLKASCRSCASKFNSEFEAAFIKGFTDTRAHLGFRSRKNKRRPRTARMIGEEGWIDVPVSQHPVMYSQMQLARGPTILDDGLLRTELDDGTYGWEFAGVKLITSGVPLYGRSGRMFDPVTDARSIAKIAHSFAMAELGATFSPLLMDVIGGQSGSIGSLIGRANSNGRDIFPPHSLGLRVQSKFVVVTVGLFSAIGAMPYDVVVGRLH